MNNISDVQELKWEDVENAKAYLISGYSSGENQYRDIAVVDERTLFIMSDVVGGTYYNYRIKAILGGVSSVWSETVGSRYLASPELLRVEKNQETIELEWKLCDFVGAYHVYRRNYDNDGVWEKIISTTSTYTIDRTADVFQRYEYYVIAIYGNTQSDHKVPMIYEPVLDIPTNVSAASRSYNAITHKWIAPVGADFIQVWRSSNRNGNYELTGTYYASSVSGISSSLVMGNTYYYKLRAYKEMPRGRLYSVYSEPVSAGPVPSAPANVKATALTGKTVRLEWVASTGTDFIEVWRTTKENAEQKDYVCIGIYNSSDGESISKLLTPGKKYYYKIRGYGKVNNKKVYSGYSKVVDATTDVLAAPNNVKATPISDTTVRINWSANKDIDFVEVWRTHKKDALQSEYVLLGIYYAKDGESFSRLLTPGITYYYKVRGYCKINGVRVASSSFSSVVSAKLPLYKKGYQYYILCTNITL